MYLYVVNDLSTEGHLGGLYMFDIRERGVADTFVLIFIWNKVSVPLR